MVSKEKRQKRFMPVHRLKLHIQLMLGLGMVVAFSLLVGVLAYLNTQSNRDAVAGPRAGAPSRVPAAEHAAR